MALIKEVLIFLLLCIFLAKATPTIKPEPAYEMEQHAFDRADERLECSADVDQTFFRARNAPADANAFGLLDCLGFALQMSNGAEMSRHNQGIVTIPDGYRARWYRSIFIDDNQLSQLNLMNNPIDVDLVSLSVYENIADKSKTAKIRTVTNNTVQIKKIGANQYEVRSYYNDQVIFTLNPQDLRSQCTRKWLEG